MRDPPKVIGLKHPNQGPALKKITEIVSDQTKGANNSPNSSLIARSQSPPVVPLERLLSRQELASRHARKLSIAIVGGGWYGCHLTKVLLEQGYEVTLFERNAKLFMEASRWNQFRLHQGFHYARSANTRSETLKGFRLMRETYPHLTSYIHENLYGVANDSILDLGTTTQIMRASGLAFELVNNGDYNLRNVQGVLRCFEQNFLPVRCQEYFTSLLGSSVKFNTAVTSFEERESGVLVNGQQFDFTIDCTYNHMTSSQRIPCYFEPCLTLLYRSTHHHTRPASYTIIDGDFISLFEYRGEDGQLLYTLTSVPHTPLGRFEKAADAEALMKTFTEEDAQKLRPLFEEQAQHFIQGFSEDYHYAGHFVSCKTKLKSSSANRECVEHHTARTICLFGGKITGVFHAENMVMQWLKERTRPQRGQLSSSSQLKGKALIVTRSRQRTAWGKVFGDDFAEKFDVSHLADIVGCSFDTILCILPDGFVHPRHRRIAHEETEHQADDPQEQERYYAETLKSHLRYVNCNRFFLVTSMKDGNEVQGEPPEQLVTDDFLPLKEGSASSGSLLIEAFVRKQFPCSLIARVPNLYGGDLDAALTLITSEVVTEQQPSRLYQFYPMARLWPDLEIASAAGLKTINLAPEPILLEDIAETLWSRNENHVHRSAPRHGPAEELFPSQLQTAHAALWGMDKPYLIPKNDTLSDLKRHLRRKLASTLAVSNSCWLPGQDVIALHILSAFGVSKLSIDPTRIWPNWLEIDEVSAEHYAQDLATKGFSIVSLHSILALNDPLNLLEPNEQQEHFIELAQSACLLARWLGAKQIVLSNRKESGAAPPTTHNYELGWDYPTTVAIFREIAEFGERCGVTVCVEPGMVYGGMTFLLTVKEADKLVAEVSRRNLRLAINIANLAQETGDISDYLAVCREICISEADLGVTAQGSPGQTQSKIHRRLGNQEHSAGLFVLKMQQQSIKKLAESTKAVLKEFIQYRGPCQ
ncbi:uncharacterized protein EV422DRAFT_279253 [Fimicolochytrium jonesii]|uniref:uncharacterized protein n=1 Tax=Fimicolochytrium jonesii TaxID=1396493 RepID=UPI0022FEA590|nr:uncharacterized protein EV422DRAFT_279253 [Fimicolochytrium jonesii]KAI8816574.1 hypothetical protein EV422DRAFT_279253 [Fimicolochytrium jonesii]